MSPEDDEKLTRNPLSTITIPPGSDVELPDVPRAAAVPDILSAEQRALLEADPTAPRWALHLCGRFEEVKAELADGAAIVKTTLATDRANDERKLDRLVDMVRELYEAQMQHNQRDEQRFEEHQHRLDNQRVDINAGLDGLEKLATLDKIMHDHTRRLSDHERRIASLEAASVNDGK